MKADLTGSTISDNLITALIAERRNGRSSLVKEVASGNELFLIIHSDCYDELLFWSNEDGFVDCDYDFFTGTERAELDLPVGGYWISVPLAMKFEAHPKPSQSRKPF